jgi:hypothetical protein
MGLSVATSLWSLEGQQSGVSKSPQFLSWWQNIREDGRRLIESVLVKKGFNPASEEAEAFLVEVYERCLARLGRDTQVTLGDLDGRRDHAFDVLRKVLGVENGKDLGLADRRYGSVSHEVLPLLLEGKLPVAAFNANTLVQPFSEEMWSLFTQPTEVQAKMVELEVQAELSLAEFNPIGEWPELQGISQLSDIPEVVIRDLEVGVGKMRADLYAISALDWQGRYSATAKSRATLLAMLRPLFGGFIDKLPRYEDAWANHLMGLTFFTWANATVTSAREGQRRIFFKEIQAVEHGFGFNGGRIDALEVLKVGGHTPTSAERVLLRKLSEYRFVSASVIMETITKWFNAEVEFAVNDWKCGIGDFPGSVDLVSPADCPQPTHVVQQQRYLTVIPLDWQRQHGGVKKGDWSCGQATLDLARLTFFLPTHPIFSHDVRVTAEERSEIFHSRFVSRWLKARSNSRHRVLTRDVAGTLARELHSNGNPPTPTNGNGGKEKERDQATQNLQSELTISDTKRKKIHGVVQEHRDFVDSLHIVERLHNKKGLLHVLHYGRLVKAIEKGLVRYTSFDPEVGGRIACLNPEHDDEHPDMSVKLERGGFHCYACGFGGVISKHTLGSDELVLSFRKHAVNHGDPEEIVVPDECHRIMFRAQELMSEAFPGSPAEVYLEEERGLDARKAWDMGAGYCSDSIVLDLLSWGFTIRQLDEYGFLGYSARVTPRSKLVSALRDFGCPIAELRKIRKDPRSGRELVCLPYSILRDKVTFPLTIEGRYTNFYGRAIKPCAKEFKHRKLSVRPNGKGVVQGGFNMEALEGEHEEVLITEAPIDALTLTQMGKSAVATVGTFNYVVIGVVVRSGKRFGFAMNHDLGGWNATIKTVHWLPERFLERDDESFFDFTWAFFRDRQTSAKDYNAWWLEEYFGV